MTKKRGTGTGILLPLVFAVCLLFGACFGIKSDIVIRSNGSGTIALEYRVSEYFSTLGAQGGNETSPPLPLSEEDFKNAADTIDGLKLTGYSNKKDGEDILYRITLEFENFGALVALMNGPQTGYFDYTEKNDKHILTVVYAPDLMGDDNNMSELLPVIFESYTYNFKMDFPSKCDVRFFNGGAQKIEKFPVGTTKIEARSFEFSSPMSDIVSLNESAGIEITW
jgi:hypothetical protein